MVLVVGGQGRKVGKSSVVTELIRAFPERRWTAIKISGHAHRESSTSGGDTARYLAAGAERAHWLRTGDGGLAAAIPELERLIGEAGDVIIESNSVMNYLAPDLFLVVVGGTATEWKPSLAAHLNKVDALVVTGSGGSALAGSRVFTVAPPTYVSGALLEFVRERFSSASERQLNP